MGDGNFIYISVHEHSQQSNETTNVFSALSDFSALIVILTQNLYTI